MLIKRPDTLGGVKPSDITSQSVYEHRREFLKAALAAGLIGSVLPAQAADPPAVTDLKYSKNKAFGEGLKPNRYEEITTYNNYYEFGTDKSDPAQNSGRFKPQPWTVKVSGEAEVTGNFSYEDIVKPHPLEERIYRMRCVEAWSMVIPWVGFPLGDLLKRFKPTSKAKYVAFTTVNRPGEMPGLRYPVLEWPYVEGLRIDEAMHPLAILAVGVYGKTLPNQNGAPIRLVTPWKYGFKGIKSIVEIRFTERQPPTSWNLSQAREYGFYANVNPEVDHPRWSQAREAVIGTGLFAARQPTLMFNGYADQVASLYAGMDLRRNY